MKNTIKKIFAITLILVMTLSMVACGGGDDSDDSDALVMTVLTESTFPPFDTIDEDGNLIGFDMDLIAAIGEDQGFEVEFVDMPFDSLIPALQAGNGDIIAAGMWCGDPDRQAKVDFSDVYYTGSTALIVPIDNTDIVDSSSLTPDMVVASQIGTDYADEITVMEQEGKIKEAVILDGFDICVLQLINGDVDAILVGTDVATVYMKNHEDKVKAIENVYGMTEDMAFAVQKGNIELLEKINAGLANVKDNGTYEELINKWIVGIDE